MVHLPLPDSLLHSTHINHSLINAVHHFFDTVRRKITFRTSRITKRHAERAFPIAIQRDRSYIFGVIGNVFGGIVRRTVLGIGVNTEYAKITSMTRPHPIIRIPPEFTDRRRRSKNQAYIIIIPIDGKPKFISRIISVYNTGQGRILFGNFHSDYIHDRVDGYPAFRFCSGIFGSRQYPLGDIFRAKQKTDIQLRIRQFFLKATRHEAIFQIIALHRRVLLNTAEPAVMVSKNQPVVRDHHSRAKTSKANHSIRKTRFLRIIKFVYRHLQTKIFHHPFCLLVLFKVSQQPHSLIGKSIRETDRKKHDGG